MSKVEDEDEEPKSALELAMARLKKQDADAGVVSKALSDEQRRGIAEARSVYEARIAEREILFRDAQARVRTPEELETLNDEYRRDQQRFANDRDRKIEEIRG
jgi:hypothetical protein